MLCTSGEPLSEYIISQIQMGFVDIFLPYQPLLHDSAEEGSEKNYSSPSASKLDSTAERQARMSSIVDLTPERLSVETTILNSDAPSTSTISPWKKPGSSGLIDARSSSARSREPTQTSSASTSPMITGNPTPFSFQSSRK